jgi:RNA polymerase sigma-70 factor (ECF subfamily)
VDTGEMHRHGASAWPDVALPIDVFAAYVTERDSVELERAADLYIACACSRGDSAAIARFEESFFSEIRAAISRISGAAAVLDEAMQQLRKMMFVADGKPAGITGYAGRGDLRAWLRVAGTRVALGLMRARRASEDNEPELDRIVATDPDPANALMRKEYGASARDALRDAFGELETRDRNILRQYYLDGLTIDELGTLYGVHRATAARWVEKARAVLEKRTQALLRERLGVGKETLDSIVRMVHSNLEVSLSGL